MIILDKHDHIITSEYPLVMSQQQELVSETIQVVTFSLTKKDEKKTLESKEDNSTQELYAIPIEQVKEIREIERITPVPRSKDYVLGIMNLRGSILPVIDVPKKLELENGDLLNDTNSRIIVAEHNKTLTGMLVKDVDEVLTILKKDVETIPDATFDSNHYTKGIIKRKEQLINLLDVVKMLDDSKVPQAEQ